MQVIIYARMLKIKVMMLTRIPFRCIHLLILFLILSFPLVAEDMDDLAGYLAAKARPAEGAGELHGIMEKAGSRRLVLLGESSHGTAEFYRWRSDITRRLITENGFSFIAVEGDWASIYRLNKYVKNLPGSGSSARQVLRGFDRWPEWMWANTEIEDLAEWLREYNNHLAPAEKVGFYGMDVYGQWQAMDDLIDYAGKHLPEYFPLINRNLQCFAAYDRDEWVYARAVTGRGHRSCEEGLREVIDLLKAESSRLRSKDGREFFRAKQNAWVVSNAEDFFRLAVLDNRGSWNSRATHMWETVQRLFNEYGPGSRGIVWAHNTHVGDAGATTMRYQEMVNIGMLSRRDLGKENVFITGFGTHHGRVNAGSGWGSEMQIMRVPEGMEGSWENLAGRLGHESFYLVFDEEDRNHPLLNRFIGHRAIGVVYNPRQESGNYVPSILPHRYDAFIFIRETGPLKQVR
jgi:erythromycin esterase